jgi:hypothetical protein
MRKILKISLGLAITTTVAFAADNSLGTWKLNIEKSKYNPAPFPLKSLTVARETSDGGVRVTISGERSDGTPVNASYTTKYDGSPSSVSGSGTPYDTISIKQANANTFTDERKKTGTPYKGTGRTVISNGGKTMTLSTKGTNAEGKPYAGTLVFDKQ